MTFPDVDSFNTYGGHINNGAPVEDPTTDRDALMANQAYCSVAAMTRTATQAWVRFVGVASSPVVLTRDQAWPTAQTAPTIVRNGTGDHTITWPTTIVDEDGVTHTLAFGAARAFLEGTTFGFLTATVGTNSVRVRLANTSGAANDLVGSTILVEAI